MKIKLLNSFFLTFFFLLSGQTFAEKAISGTFVIKTGNCFSKAAAVDATTAASTSRQRKELGAERRLSAT